MNKQLKLLKKLESIQDFVSYVVKEVKSGEVIAGLKPSVKGDYIFYRGTKEEGEKFAKEMKKRNYTLSLSSRGMMFLKNREGKHEKPVIIFQLISRELKENINEFYKSIIFDQSGSRFLVGENVTEVKNGDWVKGSNQGKTLEHINQEIEKLS